MNRRDLLKSGMLVIGGMVIPLKSAFALIDPRSKTVTAGLTKITGKAYADITDTDLLNITELDLPHVHIQSFMENDFHGLPNLKKLRFFSVFHGVPALPAKVFQGLEELETLSLDSNQYDILHDDLFKPLQNLRVLDLRLTEFQNFPKSIFQLSTLQAIYTQGLDPQEVAQFQNVYGNIVQPKP